MSGTPDWARELSQEELYREAMDYEENARHDRYDGWGDPDCSYMSQDEIDGEYVEIVRPQYDPIPDEDIPF